MTAQKYMKAQLTYFSSGERGRTGVSPASGGLRSGPSLEGLQHTPRYRDNEWGK